MKITPSRIQDVLEWAYPIRHKCNIVFLGPPGIGKTKSIEAFARKKGVDLVTFILSNTVPSEVSGMRMPDNDNKKMAVFDDERLASMQDGDILFFDEILEAHPTVQQACLTLINDKVLASGRRLPDIMIVAASNEVTRPTQIRGSFRNRFVWYDVSTNAMEIQKWFLHHHRIIVPSYLASYIANPDAGKYNILTPRMFSTITDGIEENGIDATREIIGDMFGAKVWDEIEAMYTMETIGLKIARALIDSGYGFPEDKIFEIANLTTKQAIIEKVAELENAEEVLKNVSV